MYLEGLVREFPSDEDDEPAEAEPYAVPAAPVDDGGIPDVTAWGVQIQEIQG